MQTKRSEKFFSVVEVPICFVAIWHKKLLVDPFKSRLRSNTAMKPCQDFASAELFFTAFR